MITRSVWLDLIGVAGCDDARGSAIGARFLTRRGMGTPCTGSPLASASGKYARAFLS